MININDMFAFGCHLYMNGCFYGCCVCGAVVEKDATTLHHEWHEKQDTLAPNILDNRPPTA